MDKEGGRHDGAAELRNKDARNTGVDAFYLVPWRE